MDWVSGLFSAGLGVLFLVGGGFLISAAVGHLGTPLRNGSHSSAFLSSNPIQEFILGLMVGLLGIPFFLVLVHLLFSVRVDTPALGGVFFLLLLGGWWNATRGRSHR